jgi:flavodoxin
MKVLVVYGSVYGNTEKIARSIAGAISPVIASSSELDPNSGNEVELAGVMEIDPTMLGGPDLLVVGSPTHQFKPIAPVTDFLRRIPGGSLKGVKVAAFDTRITQEMIDRSGPLPFFVKLFGYAAAPITKALEKKGGKRVAEPVGFFVEDTEGPLKEGELERAANWAEEVVRALISQ